MTFWWYYARREETAENESITSGNGDTHMVEALAWPGAVVILGIVFMFIFKKPITAILQRTKSVGTGGIETFETHQLPGPEAKPNALQEFLGSYDNPLLREQETRILTDLKTRGLGECEAANKALIRSLAGTQILLIFQDIQGHIYASQVTALNYLNSRNAPAPPQDLQPIFDLAKRQYPELYVSYGFSEWLGFIIAWQLVEERNGHLTISQVGHEYLKWRIEARRSGPFHG